MNKDKDKKAASTINYRIGNNRKMNSQDKRYHNHNHQHNAINKTSNNSSRNGGGSSRKVFINEKLFDKPFKHDDIDKFIAMKIRDMDFRTIAFLMQTSSIQGHRLSVQNLRLITTALKSN